MEINEVKSALDALENNVKSLVGAKAEEAAEQVKALKAELEAAKTEGTKLDEKFQKQFDELATSLTNAQTKRSHVKTNFADAFGDMIDENAESLSSYAGTKGKKTRMSTSTEIKAVGDMSFGNFGVGAYEAATTEVRSGLITSPFAPIWLRGILPQSSTSSAAIQYLRASSPTGEGAAGVWDETAVPLVDKPEVDFDFELVTETVDWIAGYTRIHRSMLDDVDFLRSYIPNQLIYGDRGLFVAENALIYSALSTAATAYDGTATVPVERVLDAAFGQLVDSYMYPTHILMNNRDFLNLIRFNKAGGSLEYDLPGNSITQVGGQYYLDGVPVFAVPSVPAGEFLVLDNRHTQFVSRMAPEIQWSDEDRDNFVKNLVTVRAEERAAVLILNEAAIISGTLGS
ncbi:MAG: phage major capsid protein [Sphingobacterium sp.]